MKIQRMIQDSQKNKKSKVKSSETTVINSSPDLRSIQAVVEEFFSPKTS